MSDRKLSLLKLSVALAAAVVVAGGGLMLLVSGSDSAIASEAVSQASVDTGSAMPDGPEPMAMSVNAADGRAGPGVAGFHGKSVYDSNKSLGAQLPDLRRYAEAGNSYATCVLATALDLCVQRMMGSADAPWSDLASGEAIENGDDAQVGKLSYELEKHKQLTLICDDVSQSDMLERDVWMQRSAMAGNPRSMASYSLNPIFGGTMRLEDMERMQEYEKNAENMLNRAAAAGVPEAIAGVYMAYSNGAIATSIGAVKVEKDPAKAAGAAMAMLEFAAAEEKSKIQVAIDELVAKMNDDERSRMAAMRKSYGQAYRSKTGGKTPGEIAGVQAPDSVCASAPTREPATSGKLG